MQYILELRGLYEVFMEKSCGGGRQTQMEGLGDSIPSVHRKRFSSSALGAQPCLSASGLGLPVHTISDKPNSLSLCSETLKSCATISTTATNATLTFGGHLGISYYGCKIPDSHVFQQGVMKQTFQASLSGHSADKPMHLSEFSSSNIHCSEMHSRLKDFGDIYQGYAGPYQKIPGYIDLPVVTRVGPDPRQERVLPIEDCQQWNWANGWSSPMYYARKQNKGSHFWNTSLTEEAVMNQPDVSTLYGRGGKKRVPYKKQQLKELEREYTISKFITKEKRRQIASYTNLSERQVTIWFQNRRVKDKKVVSNVTDVKTLF